MAAQGFREDLGDEASTISARIAEVGANVAAAAVLLATDHSVLYRPPQPKQAIRSLVRASSSLDEGFLARFDGKKWMMDKLVSILKDAKAVD